jgi:hypothetical protein
MVSAVLFPFASIPIYFKNTDAPAFTEEFAWAVAVGLSASWIIFFSIFIGLMNPEFRATFFSTRPGYAWVQGCFVSGQTDEVKSQIFELNTKQWQSIRPDVKAWTMENWEQWEEEKPEWFTEAWRAGVDDDLIPAACLRRMKMAGGGSRRRSSLGDVLGGGSAAVAPVAQ